MEYQPHHWSPATSWARRSTVDQVTLLTHDIEDCFEAKETAGAVLVDLIAAYNIMWHRSLTLKLLRMLTDKHMVHLIVDMNSNCSYVLKTSDGQQSRLSRLKNGIPQGSVLAPLLFNIYSHDLLDTISRKYGYADDLAILTSPPGMEDDWKHPKPGHEHLAPIPELSEGKTVSTVFHFNNKEAKCELHVYINTMRLNLQPTTTYLGVKLDRTLSYRQHLARLRNKVMARSALIRKLVGTGWGASPSTLRTSALALVYTPAEYCAPTWSRSRHTSLLDVSLNCTIRIITGCLQPTLVEQLPVLAGIPPAELRRRAASLALARRTMDPDHLLHHIITEERDTT